VTTSQFLKLRRSARCGAVSLLAVAPVLFSLPTKAWGPGASGANTTPSFHLASPAPRSAAGPGGVNIGFDFNWNNGPAGYTASFIESVSGTGATLNNCSGPPPLTSSSTSCDFAFSYDIGGVAQTAVASGGAYETWTPPGAGGRICDNPPVNTAPLTLFDCFNTDSFGQIFLASASGALSNVTMRMTCLNPSGLALNGLTALIYQINPVAATIGATPLAQVPVNLSSCPTLTSWTGHTFTAADFASIPLNFSGVSVTAGNFYGVYFAGLVPGTPPPGGPPDVTTLTPVPATIWLGLLGLGAVGLFALWRSRSRGAWLPRANAGRDL